MSSDWVLEPPTSSNVCIKWSSLRGPVVRRFTLAGTDTACFHDLFLSWLGFEHLYHYAYSNASINCAAAAVLWLEVSAMCTN